MAGKLVHERLPGGVKQLQGAQGEAIRAETAEERAARQALACDQLAFPRLHCFCLVAETRGLGAESSLKRSRQPDNLFYRMPSRKGFVTVAKLFMI